MGGDEDGVAHVRDQAPDERREAGAEDPERGDGEDPDDDPDHGKDRPDRVPPEVADRKVNQDHAAPPPGHACRIASTGRRRAAFQAG